MLSEFERKPKIVELFFRESDVAAAWTRLADCGFSLREVRSSLGRETASVVRERLREAEMNAVSITRDRLVREGWSAHPLADSGFDIHDILDIWR